MRRIAPSMSLQDCARARALAALDAYREVFREAGMGDRMDHENPGLFPQAVVCLVNDLRHLAEARGLPWPFVLRAADDLYDQEKVESPEVSAG